MFARQAGSLQRLGAIQGDAARFASPAIVIIALLASNVFAELPSARLTTIFPPGGRVGTTFEVTASGADLDGARELRFSRPGILAKPIGESGSGAQQKFTVVVGPEVSVGECEARFVGAFGISNPRAFTIGDRPETVRSAGGKSGESAALAVGSIVNARCTSEVVDSYTVDLKAGQRVLFRCAAKEIDSKLSPIILLFDSASHEVERSRHGGLLDFTPSSDGKFTLQIHDLLYRGGVDFFYRLEASIGPHLDAIFPPVGQVGTKGKYTLFGRNLPGGSMCDLRAIDGKPLDQLDVEIELPSQASGPPRLDVAARTGTIGWSTDAIAYRLPSDNGTSNAISIGLAESPLVLEHEPNDTPDLQQKIEPPAEVVGRFYPHGDRDWFSFDSIKGVFWIEIFSQRLGLPSSPSVLIQHVTKNDKGIEQVSDVQELASNDVNIGGPAFRTSTRDGAYRLALNDGRSYRLLVRDLFNTAHDNAALAYRLSIHKEHPDFRILVLPILATNNDVAIGSSFLRKGGALPVRLIVTRQDGFNGDVRVEAEDLPDDLKCAGTTIPAGQSSGTLVFTASDNATGWCGPVHIVGHAKPSQEQLTREAQIGAVIWPTSPNVQQPASSRLTEEFTLAVSGDEQEPITFDVSEKPYEVSSGGKAQIPIKIRRNTDIQSPLKITPGGMPVTTAITELTLPAGTSDGSLEIDTVQQKLLPGTYTFFLQAQAQMTYQRKTFTQAGEKDAAKKIPQVLQATCYSPPIVLKVVPRKR